MDRFARAYPPMPLRNVGTSRAVILLAMAAAKPNVIQ